MLPLMAGVLIASIGSGQIITRTGRYKVFPILGTALMAVGHAAALTARRRHVASRIADVYMLVLGLGLGCVMQVLVLAVQNAVDYSDLGVATSGASLFRSMGGSIGVADLRRDPGGLLSSKLAAEFADVGRRRSRVSRTARRRA